jgi:glycosyltransferase involved in cell wall biosynthesis
MARPLYPADTGGRIRSARLFERLSRLHDLTVICFRTPEDTPEDFEMMRACCSKLETVQWRETPKFTTRFYAELAIDLFSPLPYTALKYRSAAMSRRIRTLLASRQYDLLLCDFLQPAVNCVDDPFRPKVLFQHNVETAIGLRQAEHAGHPLVRSYLRLEAEKIRRFERRVAVAFDHCVMVSEEDCRRMTDEFGVRHASAIPIGVDVEYFSPMTAQSAEPTLVFVGSMDWLPNQDAVEFFTSRVLPRIRAEMPARFVVAGRNPPASMRKLNGVHVTGTVDDIRPYLRDAHVCVVPLRVGGGTRIKIFEALAMAKAVVSTSVGAEGLPVTDGRDILLADNPIDFANAVVRLLKDAELRGRLGEDGRRLAERFSWDGAAQRFSDICVEVVRRRSALGAATRRKTSVAYSSPESNQL